tara:strand:+ start:124 stop:594 length:471 start_codon:yes stop_codon:yes gene_type:complete
MSKQAIQMYQVPLVASRSLTNRNIIQTIDLKVGDLALFRTVGIVGRDSVPLIGVFLSYDRRTKKVQMAPNRILRLRDDNTVRKYNQRNSFSDIKEATVGIEAICQDLDTLYHHKLRPHLNWIRELTPPYETGLLARLREENRRAKARLKSLSSQPL